MTPCTSPQEIFPESVSIIYNHQLPLGHDAVSRRWQQGSRLRCSHSQFPSKAPLDPWPATALLLPEELWPKVNLGAWAFPGRVSDSQPSRDPTATPVSQRSPTSRIWYLLIRGGADANNRNTTHNKCNVLGTSLVVQWLRVCLPMGLIPGLGRFHMPWGHWAHT